MSNMISIYGIIYGIVEGLILENIFLKKMFTVLGQKQW